MPARHLRPAPEPDDQLPDIVVDPITGQTYEMAKMFQTLRDQLAGAERDLNGKRATIANLMRDAEGEARESELWPAALEVFDYWRHKSGHTRSEWTFERFEMIRPFLERSGTGKGKAGKLTVDLVRRNVEICKLAVDGILHDPFTQVRKNGTTKRHDGLHLIFDSEKFEERCNSAPIERIREVFPPRDEQTTLDTPATPSA